MGPNLCRACGSRAGGPRCPACGGDRVLAHPELHALTIAHVDCDAFYAAVEKRDDPRLAGQPLIVGGGKRGVVATACYIARAFGVRSAMPMFKALKLCPHAVVLRPNIAKYAAEGARVRALMQALTPLVQPLSIDEAFLDLSGLEALHGRSPAQSLVGLQNAIAAEIGISVSIGLSFNKFLAKTASELDKPHGFSVIGRAEALAFLASRPVGSLPGVGPATARALRGAGWVTIGDLRAAGPEALARRLGDTGLRLYALSMAEDPRPVDPGGERKTISAETTFHDDIARLEALEDRLWLLCERTADRARAAGLGGRTVTLKLKTADFRILTRRRMLSEPTLLAARLFAAGRALLAEVADGRTRYRLIGVGLSDFAPAAHADQGDLADARTPKRAAAEAAVAAARARFGAGAVKTGRGLKAEG